MFRRPMFDRSSARLSTRCLQRVAGLGLACGLALSAAASDNLDMRFANGIAAIVENKVITIDGARIVFGHGWGLVRASNTQAILVLRFEADSDEHLTAIRSEVEAFVNATVQKLAVQNS